MNFEKAITVLCWIRTARRLPPISVMSHWGFFFPIFSMKSVNKVVLIRSSMLTYLNFLFKSLVASGIASCCLPSTTLAFNKLSLVWYLVFSSLLAERYGTQEQHQASWESYFYDRNAHTNYPACHDIPFRSNTCNCKVCFSKSLLVKFSAIVSLFCFGGGRQKPNMRGAMYLWLVFPPTNSARTI